MKNLKTTVFIIGMLIVSTQTIRHLYVRCNYDRPSVLDKYHDDETDKYIKKSVSLDSLLAKFDASFTAVKNFEKGKTNHEIDSLKRLDETIYDTKSSYREAIMDWEHKEEKIHEVIVFSVIGFLLIIIGGFLYNKKWKWLGLSLIIPGFIEMIYWSSPDLTFSGATVEFIKFLNVKIILSSITLVLLIIAWILNKSDRNNVAN